MFVHQHALLRSSSVCHYQHNILVVCRAHIHIKRMGTQASRPQVVIEVDPEQVRRRVEKELQMCRRRDVRSFRRLLSLTTLLPVACNILHDHQYQEGLAVSFAVLAYLSTRVDGTFRTAQQNLLGSLSAAICLAALVVESLADALGRSNWAGGLLHTVGYVAEVAFISFLSWSSWWCNVVELKI